MPKTASQIVDEALTEASESVGKGFGPFGQPATSAARRAPYSELVQELVRLDKQLASNDRFQDEVSDLFSHFGVEGFLELEQADQAAANKLRYHGRRLAGAGN